MLLALPCTQSWFSAEKQPRDLEYELLRNKARDEENVQGLVANGWDAPVIWQCELKDRVKGGKRVKHFLGSNRSTAR